MKVKSIFIASLSLSIALMSSCSLLSSDENDNQSQPEVIQTSNINLQDEPLSLDDVPVLDSTESEDASTEGLYTEKYGVEYEINPSILEELEELEEPEEPEEPETPEESEEPIVEPEPTEETYMPNMGNDVGGDLWWKQQ